MVTPGVSWLRSWYDLVVGNRYHNFCSTSNEDGTNDTLHTVVATSGHLQEHDFIYKDSVLPTVIFGPGGFETTYPTYEQVPDFEGLPYHDRAPEILRVFSHFLWDRPTSLPLQTYLHNPEEKSEWRYTFGLPWQPSMQS